MVMHAGYEGRRVDMWRGTEWYSWISRKVLVELEELTKEGRRAAGEHTAV